MKQGSETLLEGGGPSFIQSLLPVLRRRKWLIAGISITIPIVVGLIVSKQPKVYEAQSSIVIDSSVPQYLGSNFRDVVDLEGSWWSAQEMLQTELRVLNSHSQGLAVAQALCDKDEKLLPKLANAKCSSVTDLNRVAELVKALIQVRPQKESRVVNLAVDFDDPEMAATLANTFAEVYTRRNLERRLAQSEGAATWLGDEFGDLTTQLNAAEHALVEFKKKYNVYELGLEDQQNDLASRHKKLEDELNTIEVKLLALGVQREQYKQLQSDDPMDDMTPGQADNPVMVKLKGVYVDEYARLLELEGKYLDKHPSVVAQKARLDAVKSDLKHEAELSNKLVEAMYQGLQKQQEKFRSALDAATRDSLALEQRAIEYNRLKRNFDRLVKLSEQVGGRERETSLAGHLKTNNVRVLDAALVPKAPIAPNVSRSVGMAFGIALVLAIGLAFLLEMLDWTVKTQDDVEQAAQGLAFLGLIPSIPAKSTKNGKRPHSHAIPSANPLDLYVLDHPQSPVAECCRAIRTNLLFMTPDKPARSLLVTSAGPREGKTTTAINLAISMAQSGLKTLIVDTDMRRPRLHKTFGLPHTPEGISRAILGEADAIELARETGIPNLYILPCGAMPPNPAELLHAERFQQIVKALAEEFDRVIFDSPPVGAVTDASILARYVDGTVLVAKCGQTGKGTLEVMARRLMADTGVNVLGCVLNDLDLSKADSYGYYYYYSRYGYYPTRRDDEDDASPPEHGAAGSA
jgi:capsular exopolysaccharide synthesis family protein